MPASLFPPSTLHRITSNALQMVQKKNPDYVLTVKHVTEYYDMKMVTFGVNDSEELIVAFPVFVQDHTRESMTLYELETVKVPITDTNLAANSYTEVKTSKSYIAFNRDYYIQLRTPELCMCKQIWHSYYCEEFSWLSISLNIAVRVQSITIFLRKLLMTIALSNTSKTLQ